MADSKPSVGVVMGSESDLEVMERCFEKLDGFGIAYEVRVISAHRTPDEAHEYAASAAKRGIKVIIAAAGMSAALSGVLSSKTILPVIGVPVNSGPLQGVDAALSTMQMPPGVPVACMAIGKAGAANAGIYAAQILALGDSELGAKLEKFKQDQAAKVKKSDAKIRRDD
ncbi:MAG: 5-(carboxyamino)imidazole ribonucleotide mutase [Planctomycetota bacterium]|jgi:phosphoribosylaminoimidazole carboxylase PurE protein